MRAGRAKRFEGCTPFGYTCTHSEYGQVCPYDRHGVVRQNATALLGLFFVRPEQSFYLRQVVRMAGIGLGAVQRELARWVEAGLLVRTRRGNQVYYRANTASPVFSELKGLAVKTAGLAEVLREALTGLADRIRVAFVHGSVARGEETVESDVDVVVVVVGAVTFSEVVAALHRAQEQLGR